MYGPLLVTCWIAKLFAACSLPRLSFQHKRIRSASSKGFFQNGKFLYYIKSKEIIISYILVSQHFNTINTVLDASNG
jgi:hypothetical protein